MEANVNAFLHMIRVSEGTQMEPNPWAVTYGKKLIITDFSEHPHLRGWRGERLRDEQCIALGLKPGCVSTAAGAYQLICPTWMEARDEEKLFDFSPASQNAAAVNRIRHAGALMSVSTGRLEEAITLCSHLWASFPGNLVAHQPKQKLELLVATFQDAGGAVA